MNFFISYFFVFIIGSALTKLNNKIYSAVFMSLPLVLFATFRSCFRYMNDTVRYKTLLERIDVAMCMEETEKGFYFLVLLFKYMHANTEILFFVVALILIVLLNYILFKYSPDYFLSISAFVFSFLYFHLICAAMRQGIATIIFLSVFPLILKKKYILTIIILLIGALFHNSLLFCIPFVFICNDKILNKKIIIFGLLFIFLIILFGNLDSLINQLTDQLDYYNDSSYTDNRDARGMSIMSLIYKSMPLFLSLFYIKKIKELNYPAINICFNLSAIGLVINIIAIFTCGITFGRLAYYFNVYSILFLPYLIKYCINNKYKNIFMLSVFIFYLAVYFIMSSKSYLLEQDHLQAFINYYFD